ncbi:MAG: SIR2 family NAD-dependent protein deacylase [Promethearchaeota archaeon]
MSVEKVAEYIAKEKRVVVITGAGISTPSGIPDFRSAGGLWTRYDPGMYADYHVFLKHPEYYWQMAKETTPLILNAKPNVIHKSLAELERMDIIDAIITQNIDFLHQRAGSKNVIEVHGTYKTVTCMDCKKKQLREDIAFKLENDEIPPKCDCGGIFQPDVILFGQLLDADVVQDARDALTKCKAVIVVGSSLVVSPVNTFPYLAMDHSAKFFIFNNFPTCLDPMADLVIYGNAEVKIPELLKAVKNKL